MYGNEAAGLTDGDVLIYAGNTNASGKVHLQTANTDRLVINFDGSFDFNTNAVTNAIWNGTAIADAYIASTFLKNVSEDTTPTLGGTLDANSNAITNGGTLYAGIQTGTYASTDTITAAQIRGAVIYVTGAATITLPAVADGDSVTIITIGAVAVSVDPNGSDKIYLDGSLLDLGDKITNLSTPGNTAVRTYHSA